MNGWEWTYRVMFLRSNRTRNELETFFHPRRPSLLYVRVLSFLNLNNFYSNINYLCVWQYGRVKATPVKNVVSMRLILVKTIKKLGISILNTFFKSHFCFPCFPDNTLGSRYPNSDSETPRYPNRGGGLGIRTKQGFRYPNFLSFCSDTETPGLKKVAKNSKMAFSQLLS